MNHESNFIDYPRSYPPTAKSICDSRGCFFESFNQKTFEETIGLSPRLVQGNRSKSIKGVLSGLLYQLPPKAQQKLLRIIQGEIFEVVVDTRKDSLTFGQGLSEVHPDHTHKKLRVPPGFAHSFLVLSKTAEVLYKATHFYAPKSERCIIWIDSDIGNDWPLKREPLLSQKDLRGLSLQQSEYFILLESIQLMKIFFQR